MKRLPITPSQIRHAEWALDAMRDFAESEDAEYTAADLPRIEHGELVFPTDSADAVEDLLYRLEKQLPEMAEQDSGSGTRRGGLAGHASSLASAKRLAKRIREVCGVTS